MLQSTRREVCKIVETALEAFREHHLTEGPFKKMARETKEQEFRNLYEIVHLLLKHLKLEINYISKRVENHIELKPITKKKK
jgi:hypothetical protein